MKNVNSDVAYNFIRLRILSGEFPPGSALTTSTLATQVKVSRTPVRDALRQLEADGLVTIQPHFGATVKTLEFSEFREMCEMRLALESHVAGLAAESRTAIELREIAHAFEAMQELTNRSLALEDESTLVTDLIREDIRFHIGILTAAKNSVMKKEILRLHLISRIVSTRPAGTWGDKEESDDNIRAVLAEHQAIYEAIAAGDAPKASQAMARHLKSHIEKQVRLLERAGHKAKPKVLSEEELAYLP